MVYEDFDLLIDRSGESLRAQVLNSPAGQASAEFRLPFSDDKLENYLLRLGRPTRRGTRRVESQEMNTAKAFGAALFDAVFSGDVKACFRSSIDEVRRRNAGLRIRLRLADAKVADLPWEFLYNRSVNRFIALSVHTPLVRYMDLPERIQPIAVKPPIRVLVMISSPTDFPALDVEAEWTRLNESLKDRIAAGQLAIERLDSASLESLQRRLRRESYHIFHFIGHGEFDQELQEGVLILEAENKRGHRVDGQFLGMLLHDHESLRVAILNACEGARTSRTDPFAGSAQSLVQQGIPAVIAMQFEIADDVASRFAHEFYGALADGYPIDASLTEARKSIFAAGREVEWGTPVLYLRSPDGRIFDIETHAPQPRQASDSSPKALQGSSHAQQGRFADAIVAAAQEAFAGGQYVQALDMLRRYDPSTGTIGEALRRLTVEHQRLLDEGHRGVKEKLEEHLRAAGALMAQGHLSEAWARACDALQLDATDKKTIALEGRLRKALEEQAAREAAREHDAARRAQEQRAREIERTSALTRSRGAIESSMAAGDLDIAEEELKRADESYDASAEFADLRAHVMELRRDAVLRQDHRADQVIEQARQQFSKTPAGAVDLLERFSPSHPRVTAALRELQDLVAEQNERAIREAEQRGDDERERQRSREQRRRDMPQAVERIRGYLEREELTEAAAALEAAEGSFGPASVFQELRARVKVAQRRLHDDDAARSAVGHGRNLAAAGDYTAALKLLEAFRPPHPDVDAAVEALRRDQTTAPSRLHAVATAVNQPRVLWTAAVVFLLAAAALWLVPQAMARRGRSSAVAAAAPTTGEVTPAESPAPNSASPASPQQGSARTATPPTAPEVTAASPEPAAVPPESAIVAPITRPDLTREQLIAEFRNRIEALLLKKDIDQALFMLSNALAYAPRDKELRSIGARVAGEAQSSAVAERAKAVAQGASGHAKVRQGDRTVQRARALSREGKIAASARAFLDAAGLFAAAAAETVRKPGRGGAPRPGDDDPVADPAPAAPPDPPPTLPAEKPESPAARPKPALPPVDPVIDAYVAAIAKGDRTAMLAIFPEAPAALLAALGKRPAGYTVRVMSRLILRDSGGRPEVLLTLVHGVVTSSGGRDETTQSLVLTLEPAGESWKVIASRAR
jgi:tetratricopeptide (TPR) repeat protein